MINKKELLEIVVESINEYAGKYLKENYSSPLKPIINEVVEENKEQLKEIFKEAIKDIVKDNETKKIIQKEFKHAVAKHLVHKLSGGIEQCVNSFKQDPTIKAKMINAIEKIIIEEK